MEDVLRVLVIGGLALWAAWGFMVGLRANEGRVNHGPRSPEASLGARDDENDGESARLQA